MKPNKMIPTFFFLLCLQHTRGWKPPGMSEHMTPEAVVDVDSIKSDTETIPHDHSDNINVADLVVDTEHMLDDLGDLYTKVELDQMRPDEKVFTWFSAHDWDSDNSLDGLELVKALSHQHNYHHTMDETHDEGDQKHDPAQHTPSADKQRFRRTVKIVDTLLEDHDPDRNGLVSFPEFMSAFHAGKLEGLKLRKIKT